MKSFSFCLPKDERDELTIIDAVETLGTTLCSVRGLNSSNLTSGRDSRMKFFYSILKNLFVY